ncbi:MAG TPA: Pycsar system effector family protein [Flavisolibacter sp.]|nr:Pycsar system effector family protein [Flavisolibacter sp.]
MHQPTMNETNSQLLNAARTYVTDVFQHKVKPEFVFHNMEHTEDVVEACSHMADYYQLNEEDRLVLMLSAWFHDVGYAGGQAEGHEELSVQMATQFLQTRQVDDAIIQRIASCIQATRMPQSPVSLIEKILCDADLFHLSTEDFKARNSLLKQERENLLGHKIDKKEWRKNNIQFLSEHKYYTDYGQDMLEHKKMDNIALFQKKGDIKKAVEAVENDHAFPYSTSMNSLLDPQTRKMTDRGVQTMFRTTSNNHFELSALADGKANIMISVNAIIISVVLTVLLTRLPYYPQYLIPTIILVLVCLGAMIFAILATRPSISGGQFTEDDIRQKRANLLFFGNFYRMRHEDYQWGMNEMLKDKEYLYNSMIKDIYYLGIVLARKYRLLRVAYTIFMWGLILAVIAFAVASIIPDSAIVTESTAPLIDYP